MVGNIPNFTKIDVLRCFLRFSKKIGRKELAKELELGEGTIRTILEEFKSKKLLDSTKKGHSMSKKGDEMLQKIFEIISMPKKINAESLYPEYKKIGVLIKNAPDVNGLTKLRDLAVKSGADGAVILKYNGQIYAPESDFVQEYNALENYFEFKNNDILVIAFSNASRQAENGALAIAIELNAYLKSFINEFN